MFDFDFTFVIKFFEKNNRGEHKDKIVATFDSVKLMELGEEKSKKDEFG